MLLAWRIEVKQLSRDRVDFDMGLKLLASIERPRHQRLADTGAG